MIATENTNINIAIMYVKFLKNFMEKIKTSLLVQLFYSRSFDTQIFLFWV